MIVRHCSPGMGYGLGYKLGWKLGPTGRARNAAVLGGVTFTPHRRKMTPRCRRRCDCAGHRHVKVTGDLDQCYDKMPACRVNIDERPSSYLRRVFYDLVAYSQNTLDLCLEVGGPSQLLYRSDYPHNMSDMKGCLAWVSGLPADLVEDVQSGNARRIFGLWGEHRIGSVRSVFQL